jgi:hypothetical protein
MCGLDSCGCCEYGYERSGSVKAVRRSSCATVSCMKRLPCFKSPFTVKQGLVPSRVPGQWLEYIPDITACNLCSPKFFAVNVKIIYSPEKPLTVDMNLVASQ